MGTVGENAHHVAAHRPVDDARRAAEQLVGAGEIAGRRRRAANEHAFDRFYGGRRCVGRTAGVFGPLHQQPAGPGIGEPRAPRLVAAASEHVVETGQAVAGADEAVALEPLAGLDGDACAGRSGHGDPRQERTVLAEIVEPRARLEPGLFHRRKSLHRADRRGRLRNAGQPPAGAVGDQGGGPGRFVEPGLVPAGLFEPGVIIFAPVDAGEGDRTGSPFPTGVGDDPVAGAVGIVQFQLRDEFRRSERALELGVAPSGDVVHPVAQQHAQRIGPSADHAGHVVGLVKAALAVVGPAGLEQIVADLAAIEPELRLPQPATIKHRPSHRFLGLEFPAEDRQRVGGGGIVGPIALWSEVLFRRRRGRRAIRYGSDPLGPPILGRQQSHGPLCRGTPGRRLVVPVPCANLPEALLAGSQRPAGVIDVEGLIGGDLAGIPAISLVPRKAPDDEATSTW